MISLWTRNHLYSLIFLGSFAATAAVIANAFLQRKQFYPSVVYITKSNASMAAIYFQGLTLVFVAWKFVRWLFFGQLRPAEVEHLVDKSWYALSETCLAFTVFRDDFSSHFVALFTVLLFLKCFHWLAEDRVDFMERTPVISRLFHIRVIGLLLTLAFSDSFFAAYAYHSLVTKGVSVQLVFGFEYAILCTVVIFITVKYILHCIDLANDQTPWDRKSAVLLYSELTINFCKVFLYGMFLVLMLRVNSIPLFAVRPIYMAIKSFKKALYDVIMSRRAIHTMNTLYPDATLEEIRSGDTTCIICREDMVSGCKKLPCNHIFHTHCLRSWFQRQQTCPTCRLDILRPTRRPANLPAAGPAGGPNIQQIPHAGDLPGMLPPQGMFPPPGGAFQFNQFGQGVFPGAVPMFQVPPAGMQMPGAMPAAGFPRPPPPPGFPGMPFFGGAPPFAFQAPWLSMPIPTPPMPVPNFAEMSEEELSRLEGDHRRALELRVAHLRNIQALLDAAVIQFTQYISLIPPGPLPAASPTSSGTAAGSFSPSAPVNIPNSGASTSSGAENAPAEENERVEVGSGNESDEVRRRRLNRFS